MQTIRTLTHEMPIEGEENREITNPTKRTTDDSGSGVLKCQEQMHPLQR